MRIVVIGAGGIGGWLGARLAASGQQIGFLVHGGTLEALRSSPPWTVARTWSS